jgi:uncharacterized damage-inducible protein DinB
MSMSKIEELRQELEREAQTTRRVLERVAEDRLAWRPNDKSMSLGELAMHVAIVPGAIAELAAGAGVDVEAGIPRPGATSVADLVATLDRSVAKAQAVLGGLDDDALSAPWRMRKGEREIAAMPRGGVIRTILLNHWYHHRGQLTVYLRQTGARVPSVYGPSADENPFG